ncbi:MAG: hypothetical protein QNJ98_19105 [Planctomycetota bacterium]|nr:hypothetical protein [Planctomycetota bacterium]
MTHSMRSPIGLLCGAALLFLTACGGGGGGDAAQLGALQVLNNTGIDLAEVEIRQGGMTIAQIGGGLAQGASWTFDTLPAGQYDVRAFPPGIGMIMEYLGNTVVGGQTTNLTMTP